VAALVVLEQLGEGRQPVRSARSLLVELIDAGSFRAFPDAVRLVGDLRGAGVPIAAASSSKNAHRFLRALALEFDADVSGLDVPGKPDPAIFLAAADELDVPPWECVARAGDHDALRAAGADVVVSNLYAIQP
jgi:beta-phosphoglucomutase